MLTENASMFGWAITYIFDVASGLTAISAFKLPRHFAIFAVVFPGLTPLYLFIIGQWRTLLPSADPHPIARKSYTTRQ
jgi:hypothetical protein